MIRNVVTAIVAPLFIAVRTFLSLRLPTRETRIQLDKQTVVIITISIPIVAIAYVIGSTQGNGGVIGGLIARMLAVLTVPLLVAYSIYPELMNDHEADKLQTPTIERDAESEEK